MDYTHIHNHAADNHSCTELPYLKAGMECLIISLRISGGTASTPGQVALRSIPSKGDDLNTLKSLISVIVLNHGFRWV